jgi:hypothetical protein
MGWSVGWSSKQQRFIGYGVPCICEHPDCNEVIDRGLAHCCGDMHDEEEHGCGRYLCSKHLGMTLHTDDHVNRCCTACQEGREPYAMKGEHPEWLLWVLTDESWQKWREENPGLVSSYNRELAQGGVQ